MATLGRTPPRFLGSAMRRKLEVSTAMAWEALVETHVEQAAWFISILADQEPVEEALPRYLREMDLHETMSIAVRTRVLALHDGLAADADAKAETDPESGDVAAPRPKVRRSGRPVAAGLRSQGGVADDDEDDVDDDGGWNLLRQPQRVVRGVRRRQRRSDEIERLTMLGLARAEEYVIETHVENAIGFVALFEDQLPLDRAVQQYLGAVGLSGGRAQTVYQRTMARLAEVHLGNGGLVDR